MTTQSWARCQRLCSRSIPTAYGQKKPCPGQLNLTRSKSRLFPFDGAWRLRCDVIDHAVNAADLVHNAVRNGLEDIVREWHPVGGHAVFRVHGADGASVSVGPLVAH